MNDDSQSTGTTAGHRERMRARFLAGDGVALTDEALLELLLTYSIPRRDVRPLAKALLAKFGDPAAVLAAEPSELEKVSGIKGNSVVLMKLTHRLALVSESAPAENDPPAEQASNISVKRECLPAQGTAMVLTPQSAQLHRGTRAWIMVSKFMVSRCRQLRRGARSRWEEGFAQSGQTAFLESWLTSITTRDCSISRLTSVTFQGLLRPRRRV